MLATGRGSALSRELRAAPGTLVGFSVVALLRAGDIQATGDLGSTVLGSGLALGSAACWAASTAIARRLGGADPPVTTALTSGIGAAVAGLVALPSPRVESVGTRGCASHRGHPTLRTDRTGA